MNINTTKQQGGVGKQGLPVVVWLLRDLDYLTGLKPQVPSGLNIDYISPV